jgi:phosphoglycolate phosphatase-like HAD superfamily hydrolase
MTQVKNNIKADAILWDFDGTLANSAAKNIAITRQILARVAPRLSGDNLPLCLQSEADYHVANHGADHWRDLYRDFFGMNTAEIEVAGPLWDSYQLEDKTSVSLFDGVTDTIQRLSSFPQGICSANSTQNITQVLDKHGIAGCFQSVIGYEGLQDHEQKPAPDGGLRCISEIFGRTTGQVLHKTIIYIGDHIADVIFARGLGARLHPSNTVISVVTTHSGARPEQWREQPDEVVESPSGLLALLGD